MNTIRSNLEVIDCKFIGNRSVGDMGGAGGGMVVAIDSNATVLNSIFAGNSAPPGGSGGGLSLSSRSILTMANCIVVGNSASGGGGGITASRQHDDEVGQITITNSTIAANSAGDVGGGLRLFTIPSTLDNLVFWDNDDSGTDDEAAQITFSGITPTVAYTDIMGLDVTVSGPFCGNLTFSQYLDPFVMRVFW